MDNSRKLTFHFLMLMLVFPIVLLGCGGKTPAEKPSDIIAVNEAESDFSSSVAENAWVPEEKVALDQKNPIDDAYAKQLVSTDKAQIYYVAEDYLRAWQNELEHAASELTALYETKKEKPDITSKLEQYKTAAQNAFDEEWGKWSDKRGNMDTKAPAAAMLAKAEVYKKATLVFIAQYKHAAKRQNSYRYIYGN